MAIVTSAAVDFSHVGPVTGVLSCMLITILYVAGLYVWGTDLPRDHPNTIKKRVTSVAVSSLLCPLYVWLWAAPAADGSGGPLLDYLGIGLTDAPLYMHTVPLLLTMTLFLGPLVACYFDGELGTSGVVSYLSNIYNVRNIVVAPVSEEFAFRACMLPLLVPGLGRNLSICVVPVFFGMAHLHHVIDHIHHCGKAVSEAWVLVLVQLGYTSLFGVYSAFVFVRTGLILPLFAAHAFCNVMGFPDFGAALAHRHKVAVCGAYVVGLVAFCALLWPATDPSLYDSVYFRHVAA